MTLIELFLVIVKGTPSIMKRVVRTIIFFFFFFFFIYIQIEEKKSKEDKKKRGFICMFYLSKSVFFLI
jgi:preprotein translocase subunit SecG